jgi:hypothetical protein
MAELVPGPPPLLVLSSVCVALVASFTVLRVYWRTFEQGDNCFGLRLLAAASNLRYRVVRAVVPGTFISPKQWRLARRPAASGDGVEVFPVEGAAEVAWCPWCVLYVSVLPFRLRLSLPCRHCARWSLRALVCLSVLCSDYGDLAPHCQPSLVLVRTLAVRCEPCRCRASLVV